MTVPSQQTVPVQLHQADDRLVLATPLPGLEPQDIAVAISGDRLTIRGAYRGSRQEQPETLVSEWTMGPYYRDITLPQPVNGVLTNATYGNGVLVLSMPTLAPGQQGGDTEFRLEAITGAKGQRIGHTGSNIQPTMTQAQHALTAIQTSMADHRVRTSAPTVAPSGRPSSTVRRATMRRRPPRLTRVIPVRRPCLSMGADCGGNAALNAWETGPSAAPVRTE